MKDSLRSRLSSIDLPLHLSIEKGTQAQSGALNGVEHLSMALTKRDNLRSLAATSCEWL